MKNSYTLIRGSLLVISFKENFYFNILFISFIRLRYGVAMEFSYLLPFLLFLLPQYLYLMIQTELSQFAYILLFILAALLIIAAGFTVSKIVRPSAPNPEKLSSYECGEEPVGNAWGQFNIRFYIVALVFLIFEVEIVFLFPWAIIFGKKDLIEITGGLWGWFAIGEAFTFIGILVLGLIYAWKKGFFDWVKPRQEIPDFKSPVPRSLYEEVNKRYSSSKSS
jgi:NADH-quinone oxidoreductase subunit A